MAASDIELEAASSAAPSIWQNRDYLILWSGQIVSTLGTQLSQLAFPLLVLAITHSPFQAGVVALCRGVPYAVLLLPAGALIDRWDRKRVVIACDTGRGFVLASIPVALFLGVLTLPQLMVVAFAEGTLYTFFNVAESAALPQVVPREQLASAISLGSTTDSVAALVGPALAGSLFSLSRALPFLADAVSYGVSVSSFFFVRSDLRVERSDADQRMLAEIGEGIRWLWACRPLRFVALLTGGLNTFSFGYSLMLIVLAQQMHASAAVIGLLFAAGGVGSIAGALVAARVQARFSLAHTTVAAAWVWALSLVLYAVAPNPVVLGLVEVGAWIAIPIYFVTTYSFRLRVTPDALQGRVNSVCKLLSFGPQPVSMLLTGALLQWYGPRVTAVLVTVPMVALATAATLSPHLRAAQALEND